MKTELELERAIEEAAVVASACWAEAQAAEAAARAKVAAAVAADEVFARAARALGDARRARLALNVADLTRLEEIPRRFMVAPVIAGRIVVDAEPGRMDGAAVVLECPSEQARGIVELVRDADRRAGRYATRAYKEGSRGGWTREGGAK